MFQDLGSQPASMEAGKAADCYGLFAGHDIEQADAEQAYVQADLEGTVTYVALPREAWPINNDWFIIPAGTDLSTVKQEELKARLNRPVVRLYKALYGHPDSGTMWEKHCHKRTLKVGFQPIPQWPSCYFHRELKLMLTVYVDDFKLSGPEKISKRAGS